VLQIRQIFTTLVTYEYLFPSSNHFFYGKFQSLPYRLNGKPGNTLSRWFAAFIFSFALWNLAEVLILNSANLSVTFLLGTQILYRIIFLVPAFYVIIAYLFPKNFNKFATNPLFYVIVFSLPLLVLTLSSPDFQIKLITLKE